MAGSEAAKMSSFVDAMMGHRKHLDVGPKAKGLAPGFPARSKHGKPKGKPGKKASSNDRAPLQKNW